MQNRVDNSDAGTSGDEQKTVSWAIGPLGERITINDLPKPGLRWTSVRKAMVVAAVSGGIISLADTLNLYSLTVEEFASWQRFVDRFGVRGLRSTYSQNYRDKIERDLRVSYNATR